MASEARAGAAPRSVVISTDPDAGSESSDAQTDKPQADGDKTPPAKDKRRNHPDDKKHHPRHRPDVRTQLREREEQVDRVLQNLLSAKGQALRLLHGARPDRHKRPAPAPQDNPDDATAPAADPQAPAESQ